MNAYFDRNGKYYEADNGPYSPDDSAVPLRPSEAYRWNGERWELHVRNYSHRVPRAVEPNEELLSHRVKLKDLIPVVSAIVVAVGLYYGIVVKIEKLEALQVIAQERDREMAQRTEHLAMEVSELRATFNAEMRRKGP